MNRTMSRSRCAQLNRKAGEIFGLAPHEAVQDISDPEFLDACRAVVKAERLSLVRSSEQTEIYRDLQTDELVNLWIDGNSLGFDDQIEWAD